MFVIINLLLRDICDKNNICDKYGGWYHCPSKSVSLLHWIRNAQNSLSFVPLSFSIIWGGFKINLNNIFVFQKFRQVKEF